MNDPLGHDPNRPGQPPPPPPPGEPPPESLPRKSSSPLLWILLLIALIAVGWYFFSQRGPTQAPEAPPTPIGTTPEVGDGTPPPPASERERPRETPPAASAGPTRDASPAAPIEPSYPPAALRARAEGSVLLRAQVDAQGRATDVEVVQSSRSRELDRAALEAVREARFSPALRDGKPIASTVNVPVDFRLEESARR